MTVPSRPTSCSRKCVLHEHRCTSRVLWVQPADVPEMGIFGSDWVYPSGVVHLLPWEVVDTVISSRNHLIRLLVEEIKLPKHRLLFGSKSAELPELLLTPHVHWHSYMQSMTVCRYCSFPAGHAELTRTIGGIYQCTDYPHDGTSSGLRRSMIGCGRLKITLGNS